MKHLPGAPVVEYVSERIREGVAELAACDVVPGLATVLIGEDNPPSQLYVKNKRAACVEHDMRSFHKQLRPNTTQGELKEVLCELNQNPEVHGILVQFPLPQDLSDQETLLDIDPAKDVDGLHPLNSGKLLQLKHWPDLATAQRSCGPLPCTPAGVMLLLELNGIQPKGMQVAVIGRSNLVGRPMEVMLTAADATVTLCHSKTGDQRLRQICRESQLVVAARGSPKFLTSEYIKPGAVVIDVAINRTEDGIVGDVDFEAVQNLASAITPVPRGVGPVTVAMLLWNTVLLAKKSVTR